MNYFFGIGINQYINVSHLNNAVKDVTDIAELLINRYDFENHNSLLLTNANATRTDIIENLERYRDSVTSEDSLLIYYSGHGYLTKDKRGFWLPVDADKNKISSYIGNEIIQTYIRAINSKHTLLISDSCFSGSLFLRTLDEEENAMEELEKRNSRWVFSSGRDDEKVSDGIKGANSPFASALLNELRLNNLPLLNIQKLGVKVVEITRSNYKQLPEICPLFDSGDKGGQFVFRLRSQLKISENPFNIIEEKPLDDDLEWYLAVKSNKRSDYEKYVLNFSKGRFTKEALNKIIEATESFNPTIPNKPSNRITYDENLDITNNLLFIFGRVNSGKSTIIASLLKYLSEDISNHVLYDLQKEGGVLVSYFNNLLIKGDFPNRTMIGSPTEIKLQVQTKGNNQPIPLSILEMSGEDLMQISPERKNNLPDYITIFLKKGYNYTFILVIETNNENQEDFLTYSFVNYILFQKYLNPKFILLISKWDLHKGQESVEDYVRLKLPTTHAILTNSNSEYSISKFTIGDINYHDGLYNEKLEVDKKSPERLWQIFLKSYSPLPVEPLSFLDRMRNFLFSGT